MDIDLWKKKKKELGLTFDDLAKISNLSVRTLKSLFNGERENTTTFTKRAIEKALGINQEPKVTSAQSELFELINSMNEEELAELTQIVDYVISKRK